MSTKTFSVKKYTSAHKSEWDNFIDSAKNATFLFKRDFMEYHKDRFEDFSLMVYKDDELYAVLPANLSNGILYSHQGLTYGSFVLNENAKLLYAFDAFKTMLQFLFSNNIVTLEINIIPSFYNLMPAGEIDYFLFRCGAKLIKRDAAMVINYDHKIEFIKSRRQCINRAKSKGLNIKIENNFDDFWKKLLIPQMKERYGVKPVHTLEEIKQLAAIFPNNIKQVNVYKEGILVAGTTIFLTKTTIHPQYISGNADRNNLESIDFLYDFIINDFVKGKKYFDFSTSSEKNGKVINRGILFWKESYGARTYSTDSYQLETKSYKDLDIKLI